MTHPAILRVMSGLGLVAMLLLAWLLSSARRQVRWRIVAWGLALQFGFAVLVLRTQPGRVLFQALGNLFEAVIAAGKASYPTLFGAQTGLFGTFAFGVLPTIVFFSALMSVLYHLGVMQQVVRGTAWVMLRTMGLSGAESLSAASNIFLGQTEAPLVVRPYIATMTQSELMAMMVGGMATIAGGVMAAFVNMGISAGHLLTASVISAPAGLLIAKILEPETGRPQTLGSVDIDVRSTATNLIEAAANGAADGMSLAINVAAMLIAFLGLIAVADLALGWLGGQFHQTWSLARGFRYLFAPFALLMGMEPQDALPAGELLGLRIAGNEFIAYEKLSQWLKPDSPVKLTPRTEVLMTYALCGFANLGSIGVQIGGLGKLVPQRQADLARLGFRAMLGGMLACYMTACVAGVLL